MKIGFLTLFVAAMTVACTTEPKVYDTTSIREGLNFSEGSVAMGDAVLFSNFGGEELNPLSDTGGGYIMKYSDGEITEFIKASDFLSRPKGMAIGQNRLYIADVNRILVYSLNKLTTPTEIIYTPKEDEYVNDIAIFGDKAYITVTNSGTIYTVDVAGGPLKMYGRVEGANGIAFDDNGAMYIASYPADGVTKEVNQIYKIKDIRIPIPKAITTVAGQYDGLSIYNGKLYFSNWVDGEIGSIDLKSGERERLQFKEKTLSGPADISIVNGVLYIPALLESEVVKVVL